MLSRSSKPHQQADALRFDSSTRSEGWNGSVNGLVLKVWPEGLNGSINGLVLPRTAQTGKRLLECASFDIPPLAGDEVRHEVKAWPEGLSGLNGYCEFV